MSGDPRNIFRQPDVVEHTMIDAVRRGPIFRVVRLVKRGPLVPSAILYVESRMEPGTDNDMTGTRSRHIAGFLSGEPVPHDDLPRLFATGKAGSRHITQAEYARLVAEIASNRRAGRFDARAYPYREVDISQMPLPFGEGRMSKRKGDPGYAPNWCIHYRYNRHLKPGHFDTCEAGVNYEAWRGIGDAEQPCFLIDGQSKPGAAHCPQLRRPTTEEIALHEQWIERRMTLLGTVMIGIGEWRQAHKGKSAAEVVECPACKGQLHLTIAATNGHVHGHCETEGCVSWME